MPAGGVFDDEQRGTIGAALDEAVPGSTELGAVDYVERLLTALDHDPPRIWAAPAGRSDGHGGAWLALGPWEHEAWARRIDAWQSVYDRVARGTATEEDRGVLYAHACEATYGDPAYGGNRDGEGWARIGFPEPMFPPARPAR